MLQRLKTYLSWEGLFFVGMAALIWFFTSATQTEVKRHYTVALKSSEQAVEQHYLNDSIQHVTVRVAAEGLDALFISKFEEAEIAFDPGDWLRQSDRGLFLLRDDVAALMEDEFGSSYKIELRMKDTLWWESESFVSKWIHLELSSSTPPSLPLGWRWMVAPRIRPDSVLLIAPKAEFPEGQKWVLELPEREWRENSQVIVQIPVGGEHWQLARQTVYIEAQSDIWVEEELEHKLSYQGRVVPVTIWVNGPKSALVNFDPSKDLLWTVTPLRGSAQISAQSKVTSVEIMDYRPKGIRTF